MKLSNLLVLAKIATLTKTQLIIIGIISSVIISAVVFVAVYFTTFNDSSSSSVSIMKPKATDIPRNTAPPLPTPPNVKVTNINYIYNSPYGTVPNSDGTSDISYTSYYMNPTNVGVGIPDLFEAALIYWTPTTDSSIPELIFYTKINTSKLDTIIFDANPIYITKILGKSKTINGVLMDMNIVKYSGSRRSDISLIEVFVKQYTTISTNTTDINTLLANAYSQSRLLLFAYNNAAPDTSSIKQYDMLAFVPKSSTSINTTSANIGTVNQAYINYSTYITNKATKTIFAATATEPTLYP